jgi:hypothetical protein
MATKALTGFCRLSSSFYLSTKPEEVKSMNLGKMETNKQTQSWNRRACRKQASKVDYNAELRAWVQHALLEAERNQDSKKSDQFLSLLKEL